MERFDKNFDCIIWGGYGRGNTGDELCLAAALDRTRKCFDGQIAVLSPNMEYTSQLFPDVLVVPFVPWRERKFKRWAAGLRLAISMGTAAGQSPPEELMEAEWARAIARSRSVYLSGGGYLTDLFPMELILPPIQLAADLKIPMSTGALGIGPFASEVCAGEVAKLLGVMDLKVRDEFSWQFCQQRGLKAVRQPDEAVSLLSQWNETGGQSGLARKTRKIGVCVFSQYGQGRDRDLSGWWVEALRRLQGQYPDYLVEGFCFHTVPQEDFYQMVSLFELAGQPSGRVRAPEMDFRRAALSLREFDLIISSRFHAVVAANVFQIPCVAIAAGQYYRAKMHAAASGNSPALTVVDPERGGPETLLAACQRVIAARSAN